MDIAEKRRTTLLKDFLEVWCNSYHASVHFSFFNTTKSGYITKLWKLFTPVLKEKENVIFFSLIEDKGHFNYILFFTIILLFGPFWNITPCWPYFHCSKRHILVRSKHSAVSGNISCYCIQEFGFVYVSLC
jgi:hypothetical protein